jgi:FlaA1/EpsC-like NDP-sugar epimerase
MKSIVIPLVQSSRTSKLAFLVILDFCIFPILIWLCYALRQFDLGADVVPNIPFGSLWVSAIAVISLLICGVYRFIVRTFDEAFFTRVAIATGLTVLGLFGLAYCTEAFIPTSIPLMFGFFMFSWVWFSRGAIRFIVRACLQTDIPKEKS